MSEFDGWLHDLHSGMRTPTALIRSVVRKATGSTPPSLEPIVAGQVCEVYDAGEVVVRISHEEEPRFEGERWALDVVRELGVPTPRVLLIESTDGVAFCVEERLPGERLDVLLGRGERPTQAVDELGSLLARIHSVPIEGFGYLQADGRGWPVDFALLDVVAERPALTAAARCLGVPATLVDRAVATLAEYAPRYPWTTPRLVHGDFTMDNILVDGGRISGIIDMERAAGSHPGEDLMNWDLCHGDRIPLKRLLASYGDSDIFDASYEPLFHLMLLRRCLWMLIVHHTTGNPGSADHYRAGIDRAVRFFD
ncbi:phosphotransferase family protein [Actinopolymorpha rutila]|uniref:Aminoglycoside phosphotransferase (APT) family kinase protein n=1 Tax=Actinopolymorpha rutila TaxID=446787 RepID=A0A852ZES4_9ACTN|nr:phosphotransferase [Actinopolymorpha rutila]NYH90368.1 aminoglycoside phosphotransferase (APT) family kinase protein [Actinopolymorpha rutila]